MYSAILITHSRARMGVRSSDPWQIPSTIYRIPVVCANANVINSIN